MPTRRLLIEWWVGLALMLAVAILIRQGTDATTPGSNRIDAAVYDMVRRLTPIQPIDGLVIVDIDNDSLDQVGQWPWPRAIHAELLRRLAQMQAKAIGLDLLLIEATSDDKVLSDALTGARQAGSPVVLPVTTTTNAALLTAPLYPVPIVGLNGLLGHAHFRIEDDGVVRGLWLEEGGFPAFSLAIARQLNPDRLPEVAVQALRSATPTRREEMLASGRWDTSSYVLLPRLSNKMPRVSYGALLRGEVPAEAIRGRIVLVGASGSGLGDRYSSRLLPGESLLPGVDLHAVALSAIETDRLVRPMAAWPQGLLTGLLLLVMMVLLYRMKPRTGLMATLLALVVVLALTCTLVNTGRWWSPTGALVAIALAYPWWSWRRLEVAMAGLIRQARTLGENAPAILPGSTGRLPAEPIARQLLRLSNAASQAVQIRRFLLLALERLPYPAIVMAEQGELLFANQGVGEKFGIQPTAGTPMREWLRQHAGLDVASTLGQSPLEHPQARAEVIDSQGRDWLVDSAVFDDPEWSKVNLVQLVDITPIRAGQREREQTMRFLSHDLRSPQVTILAIIELQARQAPPPHWLEDIRREAARSLDLANGFVELARAEGAIMSSEVLDLANLVEEARDASWRVAQNAGARLITEGTDQEAWTLGDAQLLRRALVNLIDNAIKYGPRGGKVVISLVAQSTFWCVAVSDEGSGLTESDIEHLFQPYWRGNKLDKPGVGLGLSFVRVVAERHRGNVKVRQSDSGGACFELRIPAHVETDDLGLSGH